MIQYHLLLKIQIHLFVRACIDEGKADRFYHMIFSDAAKLAKAGDVKELWMTHYSQALSLFSLYNQTLYVRLAEIHLIIGQFFHA